MANRNTWFVVLESLVNHLVVKFFHNFDIAILASHYDAYISRSGDFVLTDRPKEQIALSLAHARRVTFVRYVGMTVQKVHKQGCWASQLGIIVCKFHRNMLLWKLIGCIYYPELATSVSLFVYLFALLFLLISQCQTCFLDLFIYTAILYQPTTLKSANTYNIHLGPNCQIQYFKQKIIARG